MINVFHFLGSQKDFFIFVISHCFFPREESHAPLFLIGLSPLHLPTGRLSPRTSPFFTLSRLVYFFEPFEKETQFIVYNLDIFSILTSFSFSSSLFDRIEMNGCGAVVESRTLLAIGLAASLLFIFLSSIFPYAHLVREFTVDGN